MPHGPASAPSRQNCFRLHDLFRRTGKVEFELSRPACDQNLDGVEAAGDHPKAELFVDFPESVLLEAVAHVGASGHAEHIAMLNDGYLGHGRRGVPSHSRRAGEFAIFSRLKIQWEYRTLDERAATVYWFPDAESEQTYKGSRRMLGINP